jgi:hypothetical protein
MEKLGTVLGYTPIDEGNLQRRRPGPAERAGELTGHHIAVKLRPQRFSSAYRY